MSRAFVKEPDGDEVADDLPERKISSHPNYVTPRGQQLLQEQLQHAEAERQRLQGKEDMSAKQALALIKRDLRYLRQRVTQAILVIPPDGSSFPLVSTEVSILAMVPYMTLNPVSPTSVQTILRLHLRAERERVTRR